jgi:hypothetical protein
MRKDIEEGIISEVNDGERIGMQVEGERAV